MYVNCQNRIPFWSTNMAQVGRGSSNFNATVTHSRISNRVHTELKPYRPSFTRIDPHRNPCQFLRIPYYDTAKKLFGSCSKIFERISIPYQYPYWTGSNRTDPCRIPHDIQSHNPDLIQVKMSQMGDLCYSHTQPNFELGPYGIKTVSTRFYPYRTRYRGERRAIISLIFEVCIERIPGQCWGPIGLSFAGLKFGL
jgi:hypothetical protein